MVTGNGDPRYPPPLVESDLRGRRRIPHPARLDPLKIETRAPSTIRSIPRLSPHSPHSPRSARPSRSRSPVPLATQSAIEGRPWIPNSLRAGSPQGREAWTPDRPVFTPPPDRHAPKWHMYDSDLDRPNHRKPPPVRGSLRTSNSSSRLNNRRPNTQESLDRRQELSLHGLPLPRFPPNGLVDESPLRSSFNSAMTSRSSIEQHSGTERSSVLTKSSSITDLSPDTPDAPDMDGGMSVEDAISMYLDGFSDVTEEPPSPTSRAESKAPSVMPSPSGDTHLDEIYPSNSHEIPSIPPLPHPRLESLPLQHTQSKHSTSDSALLSTTPETPPPLPLPSEPTPPELICTAESPPPMDSHVFPEHEPKIIIPGQIPPLLNSGSDTRDDYGFRTATQHVTSDQYNAWKGPYSNYVAHRRSKWYEMLKEHGLSTANATVFPVQSSKVKRFVRKGIPSEFRGAAWFWYAGGHDLLSSNPGRYDELVQKAMSSPSNDDKEHIERDLHRTFPDNIHFKPENADITAQPGSAPHQTATTETQMIQSLRRVLYAFALHNPKIGYTQSLNFITGMLLLFLPEEKAFWMLHIVTSVYLPGTHEISLEGANIDLWILMVLLRDTMPGIYAKIASMGGPPSGRGKTPPLTVNSRLPDITLGLTNWLMSVFIGTLPLETTLRVWDIFFYEGSKTFFRVSLAIFKACERDILAVSDPMEVFQVVQTVPKKLLDANALLDDSFLRRHRVGQGRIDELRTARRTAVRQENMRRSVAFSKGQIQHATDDFPVRSRNGHSGIEHRVVDSWRHLKSHRFR